MSMKHLTFLTRGLALALARPLAAGPGHPVRVAGFARLTQGPAPSQRPHPKAVPTPRRATGRTHASRPKAAQAVLRPVDLNTATVTELMQLPKVGQRTAERIVAFRKEHGGFKRPEEVMGVKGIGEKAFTKLKPYLLVAAPAAR